MCISGVWLHRSSLWVHFVMLAVSKAGMFISGLTDALYYAHDLYIEPRGVKVSKESKSPSKTQDNMPKRGTQHACTFKRGTARFRRNRFCRPSRKPSRLVEDTVEA
mmetsp:Transcript_87374/g.246519  ORF Transcript_87374/g.246519 Transcript_87374/m.246519 type:complete len:106 (-) Transcript_87374:2-319(-)